MRAARMVRRGQQSVHMSDDGTPYTAKSFPTLCIAKVQAYHFVKSLLHEVKFQIHFGSFLNARGPKSLHET